MFNAKKEMATCTAAGTYYICGAGETLCLEVSSKKFNMKLGHKVTIDGKYRPIG